jgi:hypothetical protein
VPHLRMAKASVHVKRHLSERERSTIAVALELLARSPDGEALDEIVRAVGTEDAILSDAEMRSLLVELTTARKVKVCRSKISESL